MDGRIVADSLVNTSHETLRYLYASYNNTNIWKMMLGSVRDFIKRDEVNSYQRLLQIAADDLWEVQENELRIRFLLDICKFLKIEPVNLQTRHDYYELCDNIVKHCIELTKKHNNKVSIINKIRKKAPEYSFEGSTLDDFVQYQIKKLFIAAGEEFEDISEDKQDEFIGQLEDFINQLPEEKQEEIKKKLKISDISKNNLRNAISVSGASIVFAIVVDSAGFAAYTTLSSLMAGLAGIFGITLPFGFYVASSSIMAVVTSPLFLIFLLSGGAVYIDRKQGAKLKEQVIPVIIFQLVLPSYFESHETNYDEMINHYNNIKNKYIRNNAELSSLEKNINDESELLKDRKRKSNDILNNIKNREKELKSIVRSVSQNIEYTKLTEINNISNKYEELKKQYKETLKELEIIAEAENSTEAESIGKYIADKYKRGKLMLKRQVVESKKDEILIGLAEELLSNQNDLFNNEVDQYKKTSEIINQNNIYYNDLEKEIKDKKEKIKRIKNDIGDIRGKLNEMNKTYYGIKKIHEKES